MESKKLEKPCENATFQALQGVMKPDEETGGVFPTKRGSKCGKTDKKGETDVEDLTPFRRRFLSLGYSKGLMYPKIIALFYPSIEFVASNFS